MCSNMFFRTDDRSTLKASRPLDGGNRQCRAGINRTKPAASSRLEGDLESSAVHYAEKRKMSSVWLRPSQSIRF